MTTLFEPHGGRARYYAVGDAIFEQGRPAFYLNGDTVYSFTDGAPVFWIEKGYLFRYGDGPSLYFNEANEVK